MGAFYAAAFFVNGIVLPFFPVFLTNRGLTGPEIAFVLAAPHLGRLVSMPVIASLADRMQDRRVLVFAVMASMLAIGLLLGPLHDEAAVIAVASLLLVVNSVTGPLADTIALSLDRRGLGDYGRMRMWGSVTFIAGNLIGGLALSRYGGGSIYSMMIVGFSIALCATMLIPRPGPMPAPVETDTGSILRKPAFIALLAGAALIQASHAALYGFATLTWQARGYDEAVIGAFWAIGVVAEVALFAVAGRMFGRVSPYVLVVACGVVGTVRWGLFAVDTGLAVTAAIQAMHAGSFAIGHIGILRLIRERIPERKSASAQGTYIMLIGLAQAAAIAVGGSLWSRVGDDMFLAMSAFCLAGLSVLVLARTGITRLAAMPERAVT